MILIGNGRVITNDENERNKFINSIKEKVKYNIQKEFNYFYEEDENVKIKVTCCSIQQRVIHQFLVPFRHVLGNEPIDPPSCLRQMKQMMDVKQQLPKRP